MAFPDCPYPLSWGSITETPSIVLIIGRRKNGTKAENTSNISSSSLLKEMPLGEYQIKPLQSMCYNLYVVLPWSRNDFNPFVGTLSWISPQLLQQLPSPAPKRASDSFVENVEPIIRDSKWHLPRPHTPVARSKDDQGR